MERKNQLIFDHAIRIADMIAHLFGSKCEVAVHDFADLQRSLIHIAGNVTKREIGSPITDLVLNELRKNQEDIKDIPSYRTQSKEGHVLKSATVFLRDEANNIIGALCINYDISLLLEMNHAIASFVDFQKETQLDETFYNSVQEITHDMVHQVLLRYKKAPAQMTMDEKIACVGELDKKGTFLIKGATDYVAHVLGVSKFTVYNYLNKVRSMHDYLTEQDEK